MRGPWIVGAVVGVIVATILIIAWMRRSGESGTRPGTEVRTPEGRNLVDRVLLLLRKPGLVRPDLEAAELLAKRATELDPGDAEAWAAWSRVNTMFVNLGLDRTPARRVAARDMAARAMGLAPRSFLVRFAQADYWLLGEVAGSGRRPNPEAARALLDELARERPADPEVQIRLAVLTPLPAKRDILERMATDPEMGWRALTDLGWAYYFVDDYAEADRVAERSIAQQPHWGNLTLKVYLALYWHGDPGLAQATLARMPPAALQEDWPVMLAATVARFRSDGAAMLAAVQDNPQDWLSSLQGEVPRSLLLADARRLLGQKEAARNDYRRAIAQLDTRLATTPNEANFLSQKAEALWWCGEQEEARRIYRLADGIGSELSWRVRGLFDDDEAVIDRLSRSFEQGVTMTAAYLRLFPEFQKLRGNSRFEALLREAEADPKRSPKAVAKMSDRAPVPLTEARKLAEQAWQLAMTNSAEGQGMRSAMDMGERAIALDSLDGEVWALAARVDLHAFVLGFDMGEVRQERIRTKVTRARSLAPQSVTGRISEAQMLTKLDRSPAALAEADRILHELLAEDISAQERQSVLGMSAAVLDAQDQFEAAARAYEQAGPGWLVSSAWAYLNAGKIPEALAIAAKLREHRPDQGWEMAAIAHQMAGDLAAARHALDQVSVTGQKAEVHVSLRVWNALLSRDWEGALAASRQLPGEFVENLFFSGPRRTAAGWAHHYAGRSEAARVEWLAALRVVEKRLETDPTAERYLWSLWVLQRVLGRTTEAEQTERLMLQIGNFKVGQAAVFLPAIKRDAEATLRAAAAQLRPENRKNWNLSVHTALRYDPEFDFLRDDPRFQKLLRETLLPGAKPFTADETGPQISVAPSAPEPSKEKP